MRRNGTFREVLACNWINYPTRKQSCAPASQPAAFGRWEEFDVYVAPPEGRAFVFLLHFWEGGEGRGGDQLVLLIGQPLHGGPNKTGIPCPYPWEDVP